MKSHHLFKQHFKYEMKSKLENSDIVSLECERCKRHINTSFSFRCDKCKKTLCSECLGYCAAIKQFIINILYVTHIIRKHGMIRCKKCKRERRNTE